MLLKLIEYKQTPYIKKYKSEIHKHGLVRTGIIWRLSGHTMFKKMNNSYKMNANSRVYANTYIVQP